MTYVFPRYPSWQHRQVRTNGMSLLTGSSPFFCHFLKFTDYKSHAARRRYARMHGMTVCTYNFSHIRVYEKVSAAYRHTPHTCIHFQPTRGLNDCNCVLTQVSTYGIIKMSVSNFGIGGEHGD